MVAPLEALPLDSGTGLPKLTPSILNCTVPVADVGLTAAVKNIDWPQLEGLADELKVAVVEALLTVWVKIDEVLALYTASPEYNAVIGWLPTDRLEAK